LGGEGGVVSFGGEERGWERRGGEGREEWKGEGKGKGKRGGREGEGVERGGQEERSGK